MRNQAIVLLAAASSIMFSMVSAARETSDLAIPFENTSRESLLAQSSADWSGPVKDLEPRRIMSSARMITWSVCSAPSGSALSIYSIQEKAARFLPASAMRDNVRSNLCADDDEKGVDETAPPLDLLTRKRRAVKIADLGTRATI
jgi:hypothetical protein